MAKLIFLISLALIAVVNSIDPLRIGYDTIEKLRQCQSQCAKVFIEQKANPGESPQLKGCNSGCNFLVMFGNMNEEQCGEKCKSVDKSDIVFNACVKGCKNFVVKPALIADEKPIVTEIKKIDDVKDLQNIVPAIPINSKDDGSIKQPPKVEDNKTEKKNSDEDLTEDESSSSSSEEKSSEKKKNGSSEEQPEIESPFEVFRHFFGSSLIGGEPGLQNQLQPKIDDKKPDDLPDIINIDDKLDQPSTFDTLFSYFDKIRESLKSAYDKGSYILRVRIFPNGTVVKTYSELPDTPIDSMFQQPDSIALEPLDKEQVDLHPGFDRHHHGHHRGPNGEGINWKGIPMPIGKPIIEPYQPNEEPPFLHRFRECKPISFHFSTLCHDINNMFTCASMRTGLPRWFFLTAVLLTSFLLIWLSLFILATLRRLRKRERIIHYGEEYLPLYKDIDFEIEKSEINPAYEEAGPLPVKVKSENIV